MLVRLFWVFVEMINIPFIVVGFLYNATGVFQIVRQNQFFLFYVGFCTFFGASRFSDNFLFCFVFAREAVKINIAMNVKDVSSVKGRIEFCRTNGPNVKNPPEIGIKFWEIGCLNACNNLTNLEYEVHPFTGNRNVERGFKKTMKSQL